MAFSPVRTAARLGRLAVLLGAAFVAGVLTERAGASERCRDAGGMFEGGLCQGALR